MFSKQGKGKNKQMFVIRMSFMERSIGSTLVGKALVFYSPLVLGIDL